MKLLFRSTWKFLLQLYHQGKPNGGTSSNDSIFHTNFALLYREQLAIADFAKSLLVIPKTLAVNAAQDSSDLVAKLRAYHNSNQSKPEKSQMKNYGLDLYEGVVRDNLKAGVFEPAISKVKSLKFATEAAITILRIDDLIKLEPERGEENAYQQALQSGQLNG